MTAASGGPAVALLDIVRPGFGLVTFEGLDFGGVIVRARGGRHWAAETEAGDFIGTGPTREAAVAVLAAHLGVTGEIEVVTDVEKD